MPGIHGYLATPLVPCPDACLSHIRSSMRSKPMRHATRSNMSCAVRLPNLLIDRADQNQRAPQSVVCGPLCHPGQRQTRKSALLTPTAPSTEQATGRICAACRSEHTSQQLFRKTGPRFQDLIFHTKGRHLGTQPGQLHLSAWHRPGSTCPPPTP